MVPTVSIEELTACLPACWAGVVCRELQVDQGLGKAIMRGHEVLLTCRLPTTDQPPQRSGAAEEAEGQPQQQRRRRRPRKLYGYIAVPYAAEAKVGRSEGARGHRGCYWGPML